MLTARWSAALDVPPASLVAVPPGPGWHIGVINFPGLSRSLGNRPARGSMDGISCVRRTTFAPRQNQRMGRPSVTRLCRTEADRSPQSAAGYREFAFFFQAEDGIRDVAVTGVQTCALPI